MTSPTYSSGVTTSTSKTGSINWGLALRTASRTAVEAATAYAASVASSSLYAASFRTATMSIVGYPAMGPILRASVAPFSALFAYGSGSAWGVSSVRNSRPFPESFGLTSMVTRPNWFFPAALRENSPSACAVEETVSL